ncbi:MAG: hypothetical protein H0X62_11265 [Bacteroidetes bacterium]|nr:hypothetical protein [Bacteroidota bacterium]
MRFNLKFLFFITLIYFGGSFQSFSQTKGLIVKPATGVGNPVLDPDGNGMVSKSDLGFVNNDEAESEIPFQRLTLPWIEPTHDLSKGPGCGFTDFVDDPTRYSSSYSYYEPINKNLMFRFRLGGYAPNSKGYSVLIDSDSKFGFTGDNADPNAVKGNPGFEFEILLATNFAVRLYNVDGNANPGNPLVEMPYTSHCQKSIAHSTTCDMDFFYDFFIPFDSITKYFPLVTPSTPLRMVANTVINPHTAIRNGGNSISDMSGIDDQAFGGNYDNMFQAFISQVEPVSADSISTGGFPPIKAPAPTVTSGIQTSSTSISGFTASSTDTTTITVYKNGISIGTVTVLPNTIAWTLTGISGLALNDEITATAQTTSTSLSNLSNTVIVGSICASPSIIFGCQSNKGISGTINNVAIGTTINIYNSNFSSIVGSTTTQDAAGKFVYSCNGNTNNCSSGKPCAVPLSGVLWAVVNTNCYITPYPFCVSGTASAISTISPTTVTSTTTIITSGLINGTTYLFKNRYLFATTTDGTFNFPTGTFAFGDTLIFRFMATGDCVSTSTVTRVVINKTEAPTVNGPILEGNNVLISGFSSEEAGTKIYIYVGGILIDSTTVNTFGTWSKTLTALSGGQIVSATAKHPTKTISDLSNQVTVLTRALPPTILGTYNEASTSVNGTVLSGTPAGSKIYLYVDGMLIDSTTTTAGLTWEVSGIPLGELYADGVLTATC